MQRGLAVAAAIVLAVSSICVGAANYTIVPWPYGAIVWEQTLPEDAQTITDYASKEAKDVFSFWGLPAPLPPANWAHPVQTSSDAWYEEWYKSSIAQMMEQIRLQSPSVSATDLIARVYRDYSLTRGTPVPEANSNDILILPAPSWNGKRVHPLIIGVYPDQESMNAACGDYSFIGLYGPPISPRELTLEKLTGPSASLIPILSSGSDIILTRTDDWRFVLTHELTHWLTELVCRYEGTDFGSLPPLIREGIADYTAHSLCGDHRRWEAVAAAWAQSGGKLEDVPPPLWYDVGTSVVHYMVERDGKAGLLARLPAFAAEWSQEAATIAPGWRASLHDVKLSDSDRTLYEARLERLSLCAWLLDPVLPSAARSLLGKINSGKGDSSDIAQFWNIVSAIPPPPSRDAWARLARREDTFRIVQYQDGDRNGERMARARVEVALRKYREADDWQNYYDWFVIGLRNIIAAWGNLPRRG